MASSKQLQQPASAPATNSPQIPVPYISVPQQQTMQSQETVDLEAWLSPLVFTSDFGSPSLPITSIQSTDDSNALTPIITNDLGGVAHGAMALTPESIAPQHESYLQSPVDFATTSLSPMSDSTLSAGTVGQIDCYKTYPQDLWNAGNTVHPNDSSEVTVLTEAILTAAITAAAAAAATAAAAVNGKGNLNRMHAEANNTGNSSAMAPGFMHALGHQTLVHQVNPPSAATANSVFGSKQRQGGGVWAASSGIDGRRPGASLFQGTVPYSSNYHPLTVATHPYEQSNLSTCSSSHTSSPSMQSLQIILPSLNGGSSGMQPSDIPSNNGASGWPYVTYPDTAIANSRPQSSVSNYPLFPTIDVAEAATIAMPSTRNNQYSAAYNGPASSVVDTSGYGNESLQLPFLDASSAYASPIAREDDFACSTSSTEQQSLLGSTLCASTVAVTRCTSNDTSSNAVPTDTKKQSNCRNGNASLGGNGTKRGRKRTSSCLNDTGTSDAMHGSKLPSTETRGGPVKRRKIRSNSNSSQDTVPEDDSGAPKQRFRLNDEQKRRIYTWMVKNIDNPYPSEDDRKSYLAIEGLSKQRFKWWFSNHRHRSLEAVEDKDGNTTFVPRLAFYKTCAKLGVEIDWEIPDDINVKLDNKRTK
ncbi:hypothetical protein IW140_002801 [Coemansia sp. RSA 1813]|nr:hypothetical protein LPJ74_003343 [Coemansia sp. RSA 1843]KAJ2087543.1 hypothetical protein IW138_004913 [Coemansia sp. RSA 986]KAJ2211490.1 hypothetical protein EV179_005433 [Coemansia sp. RSA 487]KAJ2569913.1 hypothetical protein IW140_002801 [Coemansia sp. RSA 1813]